MSYKSFLKFKSFLWAPVLVILFACGGQVTTDGGSGPADQQNHGDGMLGGGGTAVGGGEEEQVGHSVTLAWDRPEVRENGEDLPLYELAGYEIRFTDVALEDGPVIYNVEDGAAVSYIIEGLEPGVYSFQIAAYDNEGYYSRFTPEELISVGELN